MSITKTDEERGIMFEILEQIGVIREYPTGWKKELNIVSWNGGMPKWDIRDWDSSHDHMSKGVTFNDTEMKTLVRLYQNFKKEEHHED